MKKKTSNNAQSEAKAAKTNSPCRIADRCGACTCIDEPYAHQVARKQGFVCELFKSQITENTVVEPYAAMEKPWGYRNKIASPFAPSPRLKPSKTKSRSSRDVLCGMYASGTHHIVQTDVCPVEHPVGRKVISAVRSLMLRWGIEPYNEDTGEGFMRHVVVRVGHESGEVLVTLVTNAQTFPSSRNFCRELVKRCPEITTVVQNVNLRKTNAILGFEEHVLYGPGFILDTLCNLSFRISSHSFYQVNAIQTEVLYRCALDFANLTPSDLKRPITVLDAYCGTGTIGLVAAASGENLSVIGVDNVESSIRDARQNAIHNGIQNAEFVCEDATSFLRQMAKDGRDFDVLLMDPPRSGSTPEFIAAACAIKPQRIVYVSCNPHTQVRDLELFAQGGYALSRLRAVDMFPHTEHVETVALLSRIIDARC